jgi:hypothetical protein
MPHLMVMDAGFAGLKEIEPEKFFEFNLQLFGHGIETLPYIIVAARNAGLKGLTRQQISCELVSVTSEIDKKTIWEKEKDHLQIPEAKKLKILEPDLSDRENTEITLKFITPVAFKDDRKSKLTLEPDFFRISGSLMRRYTSFESSDNNMVDWQFSEISRIAREVKLKSINVEPVYWKRFSTRQKQRIPLAGVIGKASYVGPVKPFLELLKAGEILRCGRSTSFGQGRISLEERIISNPTYPSNVFC